MKKIINDIINKALVKKQKALSEYESKLILSQIGFPITKEKLALSEEEVLFFAEEIGYPLVLKGSSDKIIHKTEAGIIKLNLNNKEEVRKAYQELQSLNFGLEGILVQEMIKGDREFVMGLTRDPHFGPCVMFGLGGIFAEVLNDVTFRLAPLTEKDVAEMFAEIKTRRLLEFFRGEKKVKVDILKKALINLGNLGLENEKIKEIDINPIKIIDGYPIALDALVILNN